MKKRILSLLLIISMFSATFSTTAFAVESTENNVLIGDVDGDGYIKANDAMLVLQYLEALEDENSTFTLTEDQLYLADVQADGIVDSYDADLILKDVIGLYDMASDYKEYVEETETTRVLYETLDEDNKALYDSMVECIMNQDASVEFASYEGAEALTDDEINAYYAQIYAIEQLIAYDYPEIFWYNNPGVGYNRTVYSPSTYYEYTFYFIPKYIYSDTLSYGISESDIADMQEDIDTATEVAVASITTSAGENPTDYDILKAVYDYVVLNVDYDLKSELNQNLYSALVNESSVCSGYAKEVQYLLNQFGISACYVTGMAYSTTGSITTSESHAWNYVLLDDGYYFVDATWGDGYRIQYPTSVYYYYLCGDIDQYTSHKADSDISWPTNFGTKYIYGKDEYVVY